MIYYFSGTGNTRHIADMLARRIGHDVRPFTVAELRNPADAVLATYDKVIIWAFPTYSWGIPPVVRRIMREATIKVNPETMHIAVTTCGDDTGNLARMFRREISNRGLCAGAAFSVAMPNTYVMMKGFDTDPEKVARQKIESSLHAVDFIARAIDSGRISDKDDKIVRGKFACIKTTVIYPWFVRFDMNPRGFNVDTSKCISCGKCGKACPMENITYDAGLPVWGNACAFCTACYHVCPTHAVGWKNTTKNKGQVRYFEKSK